MQYKASAWYYKLLAWILVLVSLAVGFYSAMTTLVWLDYGYYDGERAYQTHWQCRELVIQRGHEIINQFWRNPSEEAWERLLEDSDLRFIILDEKTGEIAAQYTEGMDLDIPDNLADNIYLKEYNYTMQLGEANSFLQDVYVVDYYFGQDARGVLWQDTSGDYGDTRYAVDGREYPAETAPDKNGQEVSYQILYLLPAELSQESTDIIASGYGVYQEIRWWGPRAPWLLGMSLVGLLAAVIFLCIQTGRKPEREQLCGTWLERVPLELHLFVDVCAGFGIAALTVLVADNVNYGLESIFQWYLLILLASAGTAVCGAVLVELLLTVVLRCKQRTFLRSTLCYYIFRFIGKCFAVLFGASVRGYRSIGMVPRAALMAVGVLFIELLLLIWLVNTWTPAFPVMALLIFNMALVGVLIWAAAQMRILQKAAKSMAEGDLEHQVDTKKMYWDFKTHGQNLNAISEGMSKAVEKQMKSERLKTELITNVSHDIKTPLTSIVNYVDLLQKPHTEAEGVQYLEVLDRQSKRLKKLTENLVEASKASTGNMSVDLKPTSVMELINQSVEEYRERLEAGKLEVVTSQRGDLSILADGRLMWRIMDNLLNNVVKYAMPGTRVYVTAQKFENRIVIAVKNISREPLNVDAEELMERFVRGDSSRHTEGTGLGLNIARSLTVLQNGQFSLTVDGDFFKAEVFMPVA